MEFALQTKNLTKTYGKKDAAYNINLCIPKGSIYGLIGRNGAGKTTVLRMITGLSYPTKGEILIFGSDNLDKERKRTGCLIEEPALQKNMDAEQTLRYYSLIYGLPDKNFDELLRTVGLYENRKKKTKKMSLGMRQRLGIAISMLGNPDLLLLDEPINGLDPNGVVEIRELILKLNREKNITFIISSHILSELSKIATDYGIIENGKLIKEFSKQELQESCQQCIKIIVDDPKKASVILETELGITKYDIPEKNTLRIYDFNDKAKINTALISAGLSISEISNVENDIEEFFLDSVK